MPMIEMLLHELANGTILELPLEVQAKGGGNEEQMFICLLIKYYQEK